MLLGEGAGKSAQSGLHLPFFLINSINTSVVAVAREIECRRDLFRQSVRVGTPYSMCKRV